MLLAFRASASARRTLHTSAHRLCRRAGASSGSDAWILSQRRQDPAWIVLQNHAAAAEAEARTRAAHAPRTPPPQQEAAPGDAAMQCICGEARAVVRTYTTIQAFRGLPQAGEEQLLCDCMVCGRRWLV